MTEVVAQLRLSHPILGQFAGGCKVSPSTKCPSQAGHPPSSVSRIDSELGEVKLSQQHSKIVSRNYIRTTVLPANIQEGVSPKSNSQIHKAQVLLNKVSHVPARSFNIMHPGGGMGSVPHQSTFRT